MADFFGIPNFEYIGGAMALAVIAYFLFRMFKAYWGFARAGEGKEEFKEEYNLVKSSLEIRASLRKEKKIIQKLVIKFEKLIANYKNFLSVSQAGTPNELKRRQTHLAPAEIVSALQGLVVQLKSAGGGSIALKAEESRFEKFVKDWSLVYNELRNLSLIPRPKMDDVFAKIFQRMGKNQEEINNLLKELGSDLSLEEKLDEKKKRELLILYQQTQKEEGTSTLTASASRPGRLF